MNWDEESVLVLIENFDLETYLLDKGFEEHPTPKNPNEWIGICPKCNKRKLCVDVYKKGFHCWVCEEYSSSYNSKKIIYGGGGLLSLLAWLDNMDTHAAIKYIKDHGGARDINYLPDLRIKPKKLSASIPQRVELPPYTSEIPKLNQFMVSRGISMVDVSDFKLKYCYGGKYKNRMIFPVYEDGSLVYYQARAMWNQSENKGNLYIKTLNPPMSEVNIGKEQVLFNIDNAVKQPVVCIVEGPIDAIHVGTSAVCIFGKIMSPIQIGKLVDRGVKKVIIMFDGPSPTEPYGAAKYVEQLAPTLSQFFETKLVYLPKGDPGDWPRDELQKMIQDARPYCASRGIPTL